MKLLKGLAKKNEYECENDDMQLHNYDVDGIHIRMYVRHLAAHES